MTELVSVVIPARDEAGSIAGCLKNVLAQTWDRRDLEVIVVDGCSSDETAQTARRILEESPLARWAVLENAKGTTPSSLNVGLRAAAGDIVVRVDARSLIPSDYVARCVQALKEFPGAGVVGGRQVAVARDASSLSIGIARALNNRWFNGGSRYRRPGPDNWCDTVYLGAFRRTELLALDGWDERYTTNQDFELNRRFRLAGRKVRCLSSVEVGYLPRSNLMALSQQYVRFGAAKKRDWMLSGQRPEQRQLLLLAAPPVGIVAALVAACRWPVPMASGVALLSVAVESFGTTGPDARLLGRLWGLVAGMIVGASWWVGVIIGRAGLRR